MLRLILSCLLVTLFLVPSLAQTNLETFIRSRTQEFINARQARKGEVMRRYYNPADIDNMNSFLKTSYISIKEDMKKGVFPENYVRRSVEEGNFDEAYQEAILKFLFKNGNFDRDLDLAFIHYLSDYKYKITKVVIDQVAIKADQQSAQVKVTEYRDPLNTKDPKSDAKDLKPVTITKVYEWKRQKDKWYLSMEHPPNL